MRIVLLVPWRSDNGQRAMLWQHLRPPLETFGWPIYEGDQPARAWSRSRAINAAADLADTDGRWDIGIIHDACAYVAPNVLTQAVDAAVSRGGLILPYTICHTLTEMGTRRFLDTLDPTGLDARHIASTWSGRTAPSGGVGVIDRTTWDRIGGMDERFNIWGGEDTAFWWSVRTLARSERIDGELWSMWHPTVKTGTNRLEIKDEYSPYVGDPAGLSIVLDRARQARR